MTAGNESARPSVKHRLREELIKYGLVSAYLTICFSVLLLYKSSIEGQRASDYLNFGVAVIKALVLGKFILIGDAIKTGERMRAPTLLHRIAVKSIAFLVLLILFTVLEEIIVGWFHDRTLMASVREYVGRPWVVKLAPDFVMLLILIPMVTASEIRRSIGPEQMKKIFLGRSD